MAELLPPVRPGSEGSQRSGSAMSLPREATPSGGDDDDASESPAMDPTFYKNVEGLLAKPAPTLRNFCKGSAGPSLPVLRKQRSDLRRGKAPGNPVNAATKRRSSRTDRAPEPDVDPSKVAEALQFCDRLTATAAREALADGPPPPRQQKALARTAGTSGRRGSDGPSGGRRADRRSSKGPTRSTDDISSVYTRDSRRASAAKAEWNATSAKTARDPRRVAPDEVDALVRNFEEGAALRSLRKQLHDSRKSYEASESALRAAARDFHSGQMGV